jgi:hypothetical protein
MECLVHETTTNRAALLYGVLGVAEHVPQRALLNAVNVANRTHETLTFVFKLKDGSFTGPLFVNCLLLHTVLRKIAVSRPMNGYFC